MYAVVEIGGIQIEAQKNATIRVPLLKGNPGDNVEFSNILMGGEEGSEQIGTPYIEGIVGAKIIEHGKDDKILIFHKKRRKGHRKLNGHRQHFTKIEITDITFGKAKKTRGRKKAEVADAPVAEVAETNTENNE